MCPQLLKHSLLFNERIAKFHSFNVKGLLESIIAKSILHFFDFVVYFVKYEFKILIFL